MAALEAVAILSWMLAGAFVSLGARESLGYRVGPQDLSFADVALATFEIGAWMYCGSMVSHLVRIGAATASEVVGWMVAGGVLACAARSFCLARRRSRRARRADIATAVARDRARRGHP